MSDILYLAWRYLRYKWARTALLVASITLILFLPVALRVLVDIGARDLTNRAGRTPLLLGAPGSAIDLTMSALYFREPTVAPIPSREAAAVAATGLAEVIPLHLRFTVDDRRVVGSSPEYFAFRQLRIADGRSYATLGEAVLGAKAAERLGAGVGGAVISTPAGVFDVAGSFPLRMQVVGVLEPNRSPDDHAVFVDIKTTWAIEGIAHGHENVRADRDESPSGPVVADRVLLPFTEITPGNLATFHFHGDPGGYPIDAALVNPFDKRAGVLLRGRFAEGSGGSQLVQPPAVIDDLLATMFRLRDAAIAVSAGFAAAALTTSGLVFALALQLRRHELFTMRLIGASRLRLLAIVAAEVGGVLVIATVLAVGLTLATARYGDVVLFWFIE